ncbi:MAG: hypothetical protein QXN37_00045 [Candidatus Anstonellaceae archaeon]
MNKTSYRSPQNLFVLIVFLSSLSFALPTVVNVTSIDGYYKAGDTIPIYVTFNETMVFCVSTPDSKIDLNTGGSAYLVYNPSQSQTVVFHYTVDHGHNTNDLEYVTNISDNPPADLRGLSGLCNQQLYNTTLPAAGQPGSLDYNNNVVVDTTAPTGGSISYNDGYYTTASVEITYNVGSDSGSGLNLSSGQIQRAEATLSNGVCGSFGAFSTIASDSDGSYTDTTVESDKCYKYQYVIYDNAGNSVTYTSTNVAKVDTTIPYVINVSSHNAIYNISSVSPVVMKLTFSEYVSQPTVIIDNAVQPINSCGDNDNSTYCFNYQIPTNTEAVFTLNIFGATDLAGNTMDMSDQFSFTVGTKIPSITSSSPNGVSYNSSSIPISVTTNINATCKYSFADVDYSYMTYTFANTGSVTHNSTITVQESGTYTVYVRCASIYGSPMAYSTTLSFTYNKPNNYAYSKQLNVGWNDVFLPRIILSNFTDFQDGNFTVENVLSKGGIQGKYDFVYYRNGSACPSQNGSCWLSYDPNDDINSLQEFNDWDNLPFWIHMTESGLLAFN